MKNIVIIGAGFAGLSALLMLKKKKVDAKIILLDKDPLFEYTPSLHEAIGRDHFKSITVDLAKHYPEYRQEQVEQVTSELVQTDKGSYAYDYVIVATGSITNYYGNASFAQYGRPFKRVEDVKILNSKLKDIKNITVIGGGYTGVEVAAILSETNKTVNLVHPKPEVLDTMGPKVSKLVTQYLKKRGIHLHLGQYVKKLSANQVILADETKIDSDYHILSAGITPHDSMVVKDCTLLDQKMCSNKDDRLYFCGDVARTGTLSTAHNAMIEGRRVGEQVAAKVNGKVLKEKRKRDWHILAIALGRHYGTIPLTEKVLLTGPFIGFAKWIIERRCVIEFKYRFMLPI